MRVLTPKLKEKNACPIALRNTEGVISEKSATNKKLNPSEALGIISELIQKTMRITNSNGIIMFDIRSMPFFSPRRIMR